MNRSNLTDKRRNYYAVVRKSKGEDFGKIFESWQEAEVEIKAHPNTLWKVFKTRLAAEAYIAKNLPVIAPSRDNMDVYDMQLEMDYGVLGSSSSSLGMPFHEHLARNFPSTPPLSASSLPLAPPRPHFARSSSKRSSNASLRLASPLRQEVIEEEPEPATLDDATASALQPPIVLEPSLAASISSKPQRRSFFGSIKSVARNSSKSEKRERGPAAIAIASPEAVARPASSAKRHKSEFESCSAASSATDGRTAYTRSSASFGPLPTATGSRTPSIRSISSLSPQAVPSPSRTPASVRSLWADSGSIIDISDAPVTPPRSPNKVYDEYPEVVDASRTTSTPNTPKFSRSALRKSGVTLPTAAPRSPSSNRIASPLGSPGESPSCSTGSRTPPGRSRSILSLDAFSSLRDRRSDGLSPGGESGTEASEYVDSFGPSGVAGDSSTLQKSRPNLRSILSSSSLASSFSAASFRTAYETATPTKEAAKIAPTDASSSPERSPTLSPIPSNLSTSDGTRTYSESATSSSDGSHSQFTQRGADCLADAKITAKKSGGLKRFLRMFGMTTNAGHAITA